MEVSRSISCSSITNLDEEEERTQDSKQSSPTDLYLSHVHKKKQTTAQTTRTKTKDCCPQEATNKITMRELILFSAVVVQKATRLILMIRFNTRRRIILKDFALFAWKAFPLTACFSIVVIIYIVGTVELTFLRAVWKNKKINSFIYNSHYLFI